MKKDPVAEVTMIYKVAGGDSSDCITFTLGSPVLDIEHFGMTMGDCMDLYLDVQEETIREGVDSILTQSANNTDDTK